EIHSKRNPEGGRASESILIGTSPRSVVDRRVFSSARTMLPASFSRLQLRLAAAWHNRAITLKAASFALIGFAHSLVDFGRVLLARELFRLPFFIALFGR